MCVHLTPDLTDAFWQALQPHLTPRPAYSPKGGPPPADDRACLRGILSVLREGCRWQQLPSRALDCPSGSTCWRRFHAWTTAGVWAKAHVQLLDLRGEEGVRNLQHVIIDSASVPAPKGGRTPDRPRSIAANTAANATS
jgi:transposase